MKINIISNTTEKGVQTVILFLDGIMKKVKHSPELTDDELIEFIKKKNEDL